jgi:quercetin dioxygenase-like cupin family protein
VRLDAGRPKRERPGPVSVEWQGQKPCEKLFEDVQIRIARCTFPPGSVHVRHSHPGCLSYVLSGGGKGQIQDKKGTRQIEVRTDTITNSPPIHSHELTNTGDTTLRYLIIEQEIRAGEWCRADRGQPVRAYRLFDRAGDRAEFRVLNVE